MADIIKFQNKSDKLDSLIKSAEEKNEKVEEFLKKYQEEPDIRMHDEYISQVVDDLFDMMQINSKIEKMTK